MDSLTSALRNYYGWESFKPGQRSVVEAILAGQDALAVLPTGGGKSLCYQLPALIRQSLVVVISPLVALMQDQVKQLNRRGIPALCLHAGLDPDSQKDSLRVLIDERLRLLYLAPERLQGRLIRKFLEKKAAQNQIVAFAIDEAHCISAWGHDFRPDYRRLGELRMLCPCTPVVALTATAGPQVRADIIHLLNLRKPLVQVCSAQRNNLRYSMSRRAKEPLPDILEILKKARGAALIYARTRRSVERWATALQVAGIEAIPYHAGLDSYSREQALTYFLEKEKPVLVATVAFGMGVDRRDVGLVLHLDLPSTPEGYLQQSGRAGRDGLPANCVVWFSPGDRIRLGWAIKSSAAQSSECTEVATQKQRLEIAQQQLRRMEAIAEGNSCLEQALLLAVGELAHPCGRCDRCNCTTTLKNWSDKAIVLLDALENSKKLDIHSLVHSLSNQEGNKEDRWGWLARRLVQDELIRESNDGFQTLSIRESGRQFLKEPWALRYFECKDIN
ncbi:RecQ family ATP-dependent DNA helicase [Prochlorococcus sp. MIT 1307]|uniref:RecQ family ATP-dependent DNA helicase n=1 Tax=Prochlorococcus sp. MIT 1307 TaxID=3096219 RepID=UPI002A75D15A|nr:RecQ family ATP-dependent DNA helicase [Prochlorococcus sp. MIT 1307]